MLAVDPGKNMELVEVALSDLGNEKLPYAGFGP